MRAVLFEGTPEEFARIEARFPGGWQFYLADPLDRAAAEQAKGAAGAS